MDRLRVCLDWIDDTRTEGENMWEVLLRQRIVQMSKAGCLGSGRLITQDFWNAVSSFRRCFLLRLILFCEQKNNKQWLTLQGQRKLFCWQWKLAPRPESWIHFTLSGVKNDTMCPKGHTVCSGFRISSEPEIGDFSSVLLLTSICFSSAANTVKWFWHTAWTFRCC